MRRRLLFAFTLVALVFAATPALAGRTAPPVSINTGTAKTKGVAVLNATFKWKNKGTQVFVTGTLDDLCPGDGYSARFEMFKLTEEYGLVSGWRDRTTGLCSEAAKSLNFMMGSQEGYKIHGVQVRLYEYDERDGVKGDATSVFVKYPGK